MRGVAYVSATTELSEELIFLWVQWTKIPHCPFNIPFTIVAMWQEAEEDDFLSVLWIINLEKKHKKISTAPCHDFKFVVIDQLELWI